jgi:hypothetical protein
VLTQGAQVISRTTVQRVTNLEKETNEVKESVKEHDIEISCRFKEEEDLTCDGAKPNPADWSECLEHDPDFQEELDNIVNNSKVPEANDDFAPDAHNDTHVSMELAMPRDGNGPEFARVTKRLRDENGLPMGTANNNLTLDTRSCKVEHQDGHKDALAANAVAKNMFAQVNNEGNCYVLFNEIIHH